MVFMILFAVATLPVEAAKGTANGLGDLSVINLEVNQNPAIVGDTVQATITAMYAGNKPLSNCVINLYADGITFPFNCNDLKSNVPKTYTTSLAFTTGGNYIIKATIDPAHLIKEKEETINNDKQLTLAVKDLPNLKVVKVKCHAGFCDNMGYAFVGDMVGYELQVQNTGLVDVKGATFNTTVYLDEQVVQRQTYTNVYIPAGGYFADSMLVQDLFYNDPGIHTVRIVVDAENQIRETIETDNSGAFDIEVKIPPPPITDSPDITLDYTSIEQTGPDSIKLKYYLNNLGPGALDQFVTVNYAIIDDAGVFQPLKSSVVYAKLSPWGQMLINETFTSAEIPSPYSVTGNYHLLIEADPYNKIPEMREDNNDLNIEVCIVSSNNPSCYTLPLSGT